MSDTPATFPTRQAAAIPGRSRRDAVTGKLKAALDFMVWDNIKRKDAAEKAGLADASLRFAFRKPHVMAYYHAELKALRDNLRASNLHRLDGIADDSKNDMARVGAIKAIEQIADQADEKHRGGAADHPRLADRHCEPGHRAPHHRPAAVPARPSARPRARRNRARRVASRQADICCTRRHRRAKPAGRSTCYRICYPNACGGMR